MSIVSKGRVLNSPEFYKKKKRKGRIRMVFLSLGFLAILASLVYFSRQERFLITETIVVSGDMATADKEKIAELTNQALAGYYFLIFPRTNAFIFPRGAIKKIIVEKFPGFKSVDLELNDLRELSISVEKRTPFALYCQEVPSLAEASGCYFLDVEGFIFEAAPSYSGSIYFVYTSSRHIESPVGKWFTTSEEFRRISKFTETLAVLNIRPVTLEVGDDEYIFILPQGGKIILRRGADLALIYSNLEAFLSDNSIRVQNDFLAKISQLDLRIKNKVFYKFKD